MCIERIVLGSDEWRKLNTCLEFGDTVAHDLREDLISDENAINAIAILVHLAFGNSRRKVKANIFMLPSNPVKGYNFCLAGIEMLGICDTYRTHDPDRNEHIFMPVLNAFVEYYGF